MLAFATLSKKRKKSRLIPIVWLFLHSALPLGLFKNLMRVSSRTYCGSLRTSLRTKTVSSPNFSPNLHCSHMDGNCYDEPQIAVGYFKRYFKYTLYIIISVNIVLYSSKDWSFNQNLAYLWSFLSISAFVSINFCNFAVKQQKSIMAKLNRIRVVLAERDLNNKWLSDKLGKDPATVSKWVTNTTQPSLEALIAIANALEVPVQELVRQEEFNQEK